MTKLALRTVLDDLQAPEEIARAAVKPEPGAATASNFAAAKPHATKLRDISTVLLLMFGWFLLGVGWLASVALLWSSHRWRSRVGSS